MKTTEEMISVMQAYADGKKIEIATIGDWEWETDYNPRWNWNEYDYRIKKEPTYRPYENVNEMLDDFCERCREYGMTVSRSSMGEPFIWLKDKENGDLELVREICYLDNSFKIGGVVYSIQNLFYDYTYKDGSPCGKKVEG